MWWVQSSCGVPSALVLKRVHAAHEDSADGGHEFWAALLAKAPAALRRPEWAELASLASTMSGRGSACRWALVISLVLRTWPGLRLFPALIWVSSTPDLFQNSPGSPCGGTSLHSARPRRFQLPASHNRGRYSSHLSCKVDPARA